MKRKLSKYPKGGKFLTVGGEYHRIYKNADGDIIVNHPKEDKGKWDTINLTDKAGAKTVADGVAATKKWHRENPYGYGGSIFNYPDGGLINNTMKKRTLSKTVYKYGGKLPQHGTGATVGSAVGTGAGLALNLVVPGLGFAAAPVTGALGSMVGGMFDENGGPNEQELQRQQETFNKIKYGPKQENPYVDVTQKNFNFPYGGVIDQHMANPNAELELEETFQTPDGTVGRVDGPSHDNGGIEVNLPEGTKIFSDRLKYKNGRTYAQITKPITTKIGKLEKKLQDNPQDVATANTVYLLNQQLDHYFDDQETNKSMKEMKRTLKMANGGMIKRANFARSAAKWKHEHGGYLPMHFDGNTVKKWEDFGSEEVLNTETPVSVNYSGTPLLPAKPYISTKLDKELQQAEKQNNVKNIEPVKKAMIKNSAKTQSFKPIANDALQVLEEKKKNPNWKNFKGNYSIYSKENSTFYLFDNNHNLIGQTRAGRGMGKGDMPNLANPNDWYDSSKSKKGQEKQIAAATTPAGSYTLTERPMDDNYGTKVYGFGQPNQYNAQTSIHGVYKGDYYNRTRIINDPNIKQAFVSNGCLNIPAKFLNQYDNQINTGDSLFITKEPKFEKGGLVKYPEGDELPYSKKRQYMLDYLSGKYNIKDSNGTDAIMSEDANIARLENIMNTQEPGFYLYKNSTPSNLNNPRSFSDNPVNSPEIITPRFPQRAQPNTFVNFNPVNAQLSYPDAPPVPAPLSPPTYQNWSNMNRPQTQDFQNWLDANKPGWVKGRSLNKGQGYGNFGPSTTEAWNKYGSDYMVSKAVDQSKLNQPPITTPTDINTPSTPFMWQSQDRTDLYPTQPPQITMQPDGRTPVTGSQQEILNLVNPPKSTPTTKPESWASKNMGTIGQVGAGLAGAALRAYNLSKIKAPGKLASLDFSSSMYNPDLVDYSANINAANRSAISAMDEAQRGFGSSATAQAFKNKARLNQLETTGKIYQGQENVNKQLLNEARQRNQQIRMQEQTANQDIARQNMENAYNYEMWKQQQKNQIVQDLMGTAGDVFGGMQKFRNQKDIADILSRSREETVNKDVTGGTDFGKAFGGMIREFKDGGIHIKPENRGKFTATKKRTGKSTEELTHSKNPLTRKRAIFAQNAKKWAKK